MDGDEALRGRDPLIAILGSGVYEFIDVTGGDTLGSLIRVLQTCGIVEFRKTAVMLKGETGAIEAFGLGELGAGVSLGGGRGFEFVPEGTLLLNHLGLVAGLLGFGVQVATELRDAGLIPGIVVVEFGVLGGSLGVFEKSTAGIHFALNPVMAKVVIQ